MMVWAVVKFIHENTVSRVPQSWVTRDGYCMWPPKNTSVPVSKLIETQAIPDATWSQRKVIMKAINICKYIFFIFLLIFCTKIETTKINTCSQSQHCNSNQ
jgi:hypothetical protein